MSKEIRTEIVIKASKEEVWKVLTDFKAYPHWNPFIQSIEGDLLIGSQLKVNIVPPNAKRMIFKPYIIELEENSKLYWLGHFIFKGLFDGQHQFELIDEGDGTTLFRHSEVFKGFLVPLIGERFIQNTRNGFINMNNELKEIFENGDDFNLK